VARRNESHLRTLSDNEYRKLYTNIEWAVRYQDKTYAKAADENLVTEREAWTILNRPRKCVTTPKDQPYDD